MTDSVGPVTVTHAVSGFQFRSLRGTEELSQPFRYDVELLHADGRISAEQMLGTPLTVVLDLHEERKRHFNGYITDFSLRGGVGDNALYAVTLRPWLQLLEQRSNCRILKGTATEIVQAVFDDHEAIADVGAPDLLDAYPSYEFVVQYRESDLNFVLRTLEKQGISFYFLHEAARHSLLLTDHHQLSVEGYETIQYHPPDVNAEELQEQFEDWQSYHTLKPGKLVLSDYNFEAPRAKLEAPAAAPAAHPAGDLEAFEFPGGYSDHDAGMKIARRRLEALQVGRTRWEGYGNVRGVTAGQVFQLEGHPTQEFNRKYLIYSVDFEIKTHALESGPQGPTHTGVMRSRVVAFDAAEPFRPALRTPKPLMTGVQTATVVGRAGKEIDTDPSGYGRVKVKFPWDRDPKRDGSNSCWVRVSQSWAGSGFGAVFHPRTGQEVLVDFLEGDPDRPIIVGRVYNNINMPPYELPARQTQSGLKTQSTPDGGPRSHNEIRFEDEKGAEELFIQAERTQTTLVKGDQKLTVGKDRSLEVQGTDTTVVLKEQLISLGSDRTLEVQGDYTAKIQGTRSLTVSKDVEESYSADHTVLVGNKQSLQSTRFELTANELQVHQASGVHGPPSESKIAMKEGELALSATTNINLDAGTKLKLQVGETTVEIDGKTGIVSISGKMIQLNC